MTLAPSTGPDEAPQNAVSMGRLMLCIMWLGVFLVLAVAAISVQQYFALRKFAPKSRQLEAKILLQTLLASETSYFSSHQAYAQDLALLQLPLDSGHHRYKMGFASVAGSSAGLHMDTDSLIAPLHGKTIQGEDFYDPAVADLEFAQQARLICPDCRASSQHFKALALGHPSSGPLDAWTINEQGVLEHLKQ